MNRPTRAAVIAVLLCFLSAGAWSGAAGAETLQAGGAQSLPVQTTEPVTLINGGFEEDWNRWAPKQQEAFSIVAGGAHGGKTCLRLDTGAATKYVPSLRQKLPGIGAGVYVLRFWIRTQGVASPQRGQAGARISIEYLLKNGQRAWPSTEVFAGTSDWRAVELKVLIPDEFKEGSAAISVHRYGNAGSGEALFDDFTLERVAPPPVEVFLLYPNFRGFLPDDGPQRVRVWLRVNQSGAGGAARIEVAGAGDGTKIAEATLPAASNEGAVELDAAKWDRGGYFLRARLGAFESPAYRIEKISAEQRRRFDVWFDERNVLHLRGKATFPLGLYNTVRRFAVVDEAELARLDQMAQAPVSLNINYTWWPCALDTRRRYLAEMQKRGLWYLDTVNNVFPGQLLMSPRSFPIGEELLPAARGRLETQEQCDGYLATLAREMRKLPGHAGWYVMDERPFDHVPSAFHQYAVLRAADPDHPTFGVSNRPEELFLWRDALDVFGLDPYPLMNLKAGRPLSLAGEWTRAGAEATHGARPLWMVIQFFQGWSTDRWPTEEELRAMSLMAVVEGARGLFYWSFGGRALADVRDPKLREEHWRRVVKVAKELKAIEPALIAPDAPELVKAVSDSRVRWRAREAGGKWFVFAWLPAAKFAERSEQPPVEVTFTLKDGRAIRRTFRPDTADWFEAAGKQM